MTLGWSSVCNPIPHTKFTFKAELEPGSDHHNPAPLSTLKKCLDEGETN